MKNCSNIQHILVLIILFGSCFVYTINYLTISRKKKKNRPHLNIVLVLVQSRSFCYFASLFFPLRVNCIARHAYFFKPGLALLVSCKQNPRLLPPFKIGKIDEGSPQPGQLADDVHSVIWGIQKTSTSSGSTSDFFFFDRICGSTSDCTTDGKCSLVTR